MTSTTIRPTSVIQNTQGYPTPIADITDNSDSTYDTMTVGAYFYQMQYGGFTLPGGAVVKSVQQRVRAGGFATWSTPVYLVIQGSAQAGMTVSGTGATGVNFSSPVLSGAYSQADVNGSSLYVDQSSGAGNGGGTRLMEAYLDIVYANAPVTSAVTVSPSGTITTTLKPTIGWTFTPDSGLGLSQTYFQVKAFNAAQYGAGGFDPNTSGADYDTGAVNSGSASHVIANNLHNGLTYKAYVRAWDTVNGVNQPSAWVASSTFTFAVVVPTPTAVSPVASSTVTSSRPAVNANFAAHPAGSLTARQFQFASDAGFTTGLLSVQDTVWNNSGVAIGFIGAGNSLPNRLAQGTWYVRARAFDVDGIYSSYSAGNSFVVAHAPTAATPSPTGGNSIQYSATPTVSWAFSDIDTDDFQTKFQVQMWKTSAPGTVLDSTLTTSGNQFYQFLTGIDTTWKDTELRYKIRVYDQDNVTAGYTAEQIFYLRDLPTPALVHPSAAEVMTTSAPLITWTFTDTAGRTQAQWKVDIIRAGVTIASSGFTSGTALLWQVPSPVVTVGPTHQCTLTVIDSVGLQSSVTNNFTATYAAATTPIWTIDATQYTAAGVNTINWPSAVPDGNFYSWRVYRRVTGTTTWSLLYETNTVGTRTYKDYTAPSQVQVDYVVVQTDLSFSVQIESAYVSQSTTGTTYKYMLVCPSLDSLNLVFDKVNAETLDTEQEIAVIKLLGRGRRVEYGNKFGVEGTLTGAFKDIVGGLSSRAQRLKLDALRDSQRIIYLRNPFGDVIQVALMQAKYDRVAGVGILEYVSFSIDYVEVTA